MKLNLPLNRRELLGVGALWLLSCQLVVAQVQSIKHFGIDRNVFPSRIECIDQSSDGRLLVGTLAGLVLYDGHNFTLLTENEGLAENAVSSVVCLDSVAWIGHWAGNLSVLNVYSQKVEVIDIRTQINYSTISFLQPLPDGRMLVGTDNSGLFTFMDGRVERVVLGSGGNSQTMMDAIIHDGTLYVTTDRSVWQSPIAESKFAWTKVLDSDMHIRTMHISTEEQLLIGTDNGLAALDLKTGETDNTLMFQDYAIECIEEDREEFLWIGTREKGVIKYRPQTQEVEYIDQDRGLSYDEIRKIFMDAEGITWIATSAGLDKYVNGGFQLYNRNSGLQGSLIWDVALTIPDGSAGYICSNRGIDRFSADGASLVFESVPLSRTMETEVFQQVFIDGQSTLWALSADGEAFYGIGDGEWQQFDYEGRIACVAEGPDNKLWFGTDNGIMLYDGNQREFFNEASGLGGREIIRIYHDLSTNSVWISAIGGQLTVYRDGTFRSFGPDDGVDSKIIQDIASDNQGRMWFATYDKGLLYYDGDVFSSINKSTGLATNSIYALTFDGDHTLWIGHNWGLEKIDVRDLSTESFGYEEGFLGLEVNPAALASTSSGELFIGTLLGLSTFAPASRRVSTTPPNIHLRSALVNGGVPQGNVFDYDQSDWQFTVSAITLDKAHNTEVMYLLKGLSRDWQSIDYPYEVLFPSLPPGEYELMIKTCTAADTCNEAVSLYAFEIEMPFFRTWWFFTLLFVGVIIVIISLDRFRVASMRDEQLLVEDKLLARSADLAEVKNELAVMKSHDSIERGLIKRLVEQTFEGKQRIEETLPNSFFIHRERAQIASEYYRIDDWNQGSLVSFFDFGANSFLSGQLATSALVAFKEELTKHTSISELVKGMNKALLNLLDRLFDPSKNQGIRMAFIFLEKGSQRLHFFSAGYELVALGLDENAEIEEFVPMWNVMGKNDNNANIDIDIIEGRGKQFFLFSDGWTNQLSSDGTKTYSRSRLIKSIQRSAGMSSDIQAEMVESAFHDWRGEMELLEDLTMLTWKFSG